eukprot:COSAG06_NODE_32258_length_509_cov_0.634146_2_plen_96_part_01
MRSGIPGATPWFVPFQELLLRVHHGSSFTGIKVPPASIRRAVIAQSLSARGGPLFVALPVPIPRLLRPVLLLRWLLCRLFVVSAIPLASRPSTTPT